MLWAGLQVISQDHFNLSDLRPKAIIESCEEFQAIIQVLAHFYKLYHRVKKTVAILNVITYVVCGDIRM